MLDFITNPFAGGESGKKIRKAVDILEKELIKRKIEHTFHFTTYRKEAIKITQEIIKNGGTDIIVVGGDGTLHEVLNGFSDFDRVNLGIIPCGTGNDFAAALKIPFKPIEALDLILNGEAKYTDYMQMPTVRGINIIGMGVDVAVLKRYEALKRKTKFGYTSCLIKTLANFEYSDFDATIDGEKNHYRSFIACVANGHRYGGGIPICPVADPTDGKLNFVAATEMSKARIIKAFIKLKLGRIFDLKEVYHKTFTEVKIDAQKPYTVNVDGELYDDIPFEVKIVSNTLKFYR